MARGGLLQLAAADTDDLRIVGNPHITYFLAVYKRHTNFAIETISQLVNGDPKFGTKVSYVIGKYGDLLKDIRLIVELPQLEGTGTSDYSDYPYIASWINGIGHAMIKTATISLDNTNINKKYGLWLDIWTELTMTSEHREAYYSMIGKHENFNINSNNKKMYMEIPLQFWFSKNIGLALPLISLYDQELKVTIEIEKFDKLWVSSTGEKPLVPKINNFYIDLDYVFLEIQERERFTLRPQEYLIEQEQAIFETLDNKNEYNRIPLNFDSMVNELVWVMQKNNVYLPVINGGNEYLNFSNTFSYESSYGNDGDIMLTGRIELEGVDRVEERNADYFRRSTMINSHRNVPNGNNNIYGYSFSLNPENFQPMGHCNFESIDNKYLVIKADKRFNNPTCMIFAKSYNFIRFEYGMLHIFHI